MKHEVIQAEKAARVSMSPRKRLIQLLRDQSRWPDDFVWRYSSMSHCALGLAEARRILLVEIRRDIGDERYLEIFYYGPPYSSPDDIADRLEACDG